MDHPDYKLYEDEFGVRHWRYRFAGLLLVCGAGRSKAETGPYVIEDMYPTCLACIVVLMREEGR